LEAIAALPWIKNLVRVYPAHPGLQHLAHAGHHAPVSRSPDRRDACCPVG